MGFEPNLFRSKASNLPLASCTSTITDTAKRKKVFLIVRKKTFFFFFFLSLQSVWSLVQIILYFFNADLTKKTLIWFISSFLPSMHAFAHPHTLTHTRTCTLTHTLAHLHTHSHTYTRTSTLTHALAHLHMHLHTYTHTRTLKHILTHALAHFHKHLHTHLHTHSHPNYSIFHQTTNFWSSQTWLDIYFISFVSFRFWAVRMA